MSTSTDTVLGKRRRQSLDQSEMETQALFDTLDTDDTVVHERGEEIVHREFYYLEAHFKGNVLSSKNNLQDVGRDRIIVGRNNKAFQKYLGRFISKKVAVLDMSHRFNEVSEQLYARIDLLSTTYKHVLWLERPKRPLKAMAAADGVLSQELYENDVIYFSDSDNRIDRSLCIQIKKARRSVGVKASLLSESQSRESRESQSQESRESQESEESKSVDESDVASSESSARSADDGAVRADAFSEKRVSLTLLGNTSQLQVPVRTELQELAHSLEHFFVRHPQEDVRVQLLLPTSDENQRLNVAAILAPLEAKYRPRLELVPCPLGQDQVADLLVASLFGMHCGAFFLNSRHTLRVRASSSLILGVHYRDIALRVNRVLPRLEKTGARLECTPFMQPSDVRTNTFRVSPYKYDEGRVSAAAVSTARKFEAASFNNGEWDLAFLLSDHVVTDRSIDRSDRSDDRSDRSDRLVERHVIMTTPPSCNAACVGLPPVCPPFTPLMNEDQRLRQHLRLCYTKALAAACEKLPIEPSVFSLDELLALERQELTEGSAFFETNLPPLRPPSEQQKAAAKAFVNSKFGWKDALIAYVQDEVPEVLRPLVYLRDRHVVAVFDLFAKSADHLLLLPRRRVACVRSLRRNRADIETVRRLRNRAVLLSLTFAKRAAEADPSVSASVHLSRRLMGFHAKPSLTQLHCHVLHAHLDTNCFKNKKHWHSFLSEFLLSPERVLACLTDASEQSRSLQYLDVEYYETLLKRPQIRCPRCGQCFHRHFLQARTHLLSTEGVCEKYAEPWPRLSKPLRFK